MTRGGGAGDDRPGTALVLTPRGRLVAVVLAVLLVLALVLGVRSVLGSGSAAAAGTASTTSPTERSTARTTASPSRSHPTSTARATSTRSTTRATTSASKSPTRTSTTRSVEGSAKAIPHSGLVGTGRFTTSTVAIPAARTTRTTHTFVVQVEGGVKADPNDVARQIETTLNDPRGWIGYQGASFAAVATRKQAQFVIYLASPPTVDRMCVGVTTQGTWNCEVGKNVVLNSDRWTLMTPTYSDLADYRSYMVNHEIGHFLGRHHVGCPKAGNPAPVMLRQSMSLEGCVRNAWPRKADLAS